MRFGDERLPARFWAKISIDAATGCWIWTGSLAGGGYGTFRLSRPRRHEYAHRVSWQAANGPIPRESILDHFKCNTPSCVRDEHVRPATIRENVLRSSNFASLNLAKTHCPQGHDYGITAKLSSKNQRSCRACDAERHRAKRRLVSLQRTAQCAL